MGGLVHPGAFLLEEGTGQAALRDGDGDALELLGDGVAWGRAHEEA
jgi:hypothetical protein